MLRITCRQSVPSSHYCSGSISWTSRIFYFPDSRDLLGVLKGRSWQRERERETPGRIARKTRGIARKTRGITRNYVGIPRNYLGIARKTRGFAMGRTKRKYTEAECAPVQPFDDEKLAAYTRSLFKPINRLPKSSHSSRAEFEFLGIAQNYYEFLGILLGISESSTNHRSQSTYSERLALLPLCRPL